MNESDRIADLLIRWEKLRAEGQDVTSDELCADCPQLAEEVATRIAAMRKVQALLGVGLSADGVLAIRPNDSSTSERGRERESRPSISGYEILDSLGQGGMGIVYLARQQNLSRFVAIKMLDVSLAQTCHLERFFDEAHAIARIQHPNIVEIFDFGTVDDVPYFAMEFVDGGNLKDRLTNGAIPHEEAATLTASIADAIHVVHLEGFVHRDLKPANILLTRNGEAKVTDFGLVKRLDGETGRSRTGELLGTAGYLAPEQLDRSLGEIEPRTDVYALGVVLYEMLTGKPLFPKNPALALQQLLRRPPPRPTRSRPNLPLDVEAICLKCLETKVEDRYPSASALSDDLNRFINGQPVVARRMSRIRRATRWVQHRPYASAIILLLCVTFAAWPATAIMTERYEVAARKTLALNVAPQAREILSRNCFGCHGGDSQDVVKNLDVLNHSSLLDSTRRIVVAGKPLESRLIQRIEDGSMPPEEMEESLPRLTQREVVILTQWISGGAPPFPVENPQNPTAPVEEFSAAAEQAKIVFRQHCYDCHRYDLAEGGINILNHRLLVHLRRVILPNRADESELYQMILGKNDTAERTVNHARLLNPVERDTVRRWIELGAPAFPITEE